MDPIWRLIAERLKTLREHWAGWSVIGSAALYLLGYLVTRYQLTVLGLGTSLDVVDEKYLFAGARFAVYLLTTLPTIVMVALLAWSVAWLLGRFASALLGAKARAGMNAGWMSFCNWWRNPVRLCLAGTAFSVVIIQVAMKQCFLFSNLLLKTELPEPSWLRALLLAETDGIPALCFAALVTAALITAAIQGAVRSLSSPGTGSVATGLEIVLATLLGVQILLLPVNYSYWVAGKMFPRVSAAGNEKLRSGEAVWLIWETGKETTFLVGNRTNLLADHKLLTIPAKETERTEILGYDALFRILFEARPCTNSPAKQ